MGLRRRSIYRIAKGFRRGCEVEFPPVVTAGRLLDDERAGELKEANVEVAGLDAVNARGLRKAKFTNHDGTGAGLAMAPNSNLEPQIL